MARPKKEGLDYFPLDVDMDQDDKIALIEAKHGLIGFSIVVKILMKIYKNGYFIEWTEREQLLFSSRVNVDKNLLNEIINDCINWGLFDENVYKNFNVLTSKGIQARYIEAILRRKEVTFTESLLLIEPMDYVKNSKMKIKIINANKEVINVDINSNNASNNPQSKSKSKSESNNFKDNEEEERNPAAQQNSVIDLLIKNNLIPPYGITETLVEDIRDIYDNFSFDNPFEIIDLAIKDCVRGNGRTWKFVYNRLNDWVKRGVKTANDVKKIQEQELFRKRQNSQKRANTPIRTEILPDWFNENENESKKYTHHEDQEVQEEQKRELQEMLNSIRSG